MSRNGVAKSMYRPPGQLWKWELAPALVTDELAFHNLHFVAASKTMNCSNHSIQTVVLFTTHPVALSGSSCLHYTQEGISPGESQFAGVWQQRKHPNSQQRWNHVHSCHQQVPNAGHIFTWHDPHPSGLLHGTQGTWTRKGMIEELESSVRTTWPSIGSPEKLPHRCRIFFPITPATLLFPGPPSYKENQFQEQMLPLLGACWPIVNFSIDLAMLTNPLQWWLLCCGHRAAHRPLAVGAPVHRNQKHGVWSTREIMDSS